MPNIDGTQFGEEDYQVYLGHCRGLLHDYVQRGGDLDDLATTMIVNKRTLFRFLDGTTKRPSSWTLTRLQKALGYRTAIVPVELGVIPGEVGAERRQSSESETRLTRVPAGIR